MAVRLERGTLIALAIFSLALTLATRFSTLPNSQARAVKSASSRLNETKLIDLDATRYAVPPVSRTSFRPTVVYVRVLPSSPTLLCASLSTSLYNRPPPSSFGFLL
jgi:hypothetical protein